MLLDPRSLHVELLLSCWELAPLLLYVLNALLEPHIRKFFLRLTDMIQLEQLKRGLKLGLKLGTLHLRTVCVGLLLQIRLDRIAAVFVLIRALPLKAHHLLLMFFLVDGLFSFAHHLVPPLLDGVLQVLARYIWVLLLQTLSLLALVDVERCLGLAWRYTDLDLYGFRQLLDERVVVLHRE